MKFSLYNPSSNIFAVTASELQGVNQLGLKLWS